MNIGSLPPFLKEQFLGFRWGGNALISLYISVISGIIVALQYTAAEPFHSTTAIELLAPYGSFWRAMHYYSSQAFFFLLLLHFMAVAWDNTHTYARPAWVRLTLSLPIGLLLLFTGYVLRDDATGEAAGLIAENIALSIPLFGKWLNSLLFAVTTEGMKRIYANHLAGLMVIGAYCVWPHLRRYTARWRDNLTMTVIVTLLSVFLVAPIEPMRLGLLHISGPWFFLGLQEALRYIHPFWAGIALPAIPVLAILYLPHGGKRRTVYLWLIWSWLGIYALLSVIGYSRG